MRALATLLLAPPFDFAFFARESSTTSNKLTFLFLSVPIKFKTLIPRPRSVQTGAGTKMLLLGLKLMFVIINYKTTRPNADG
ncbi:hypothetical protein VIGAN_04386600, partial [Vigna angularis var. angularis]